MTYRYLESTNGGGGTPCSTFSFYLASGTENMTAELRDQPACNNTFVSSGAALTDGQWHHGTLVRDAGTNRIQVYLDGIQIVDQATITTGDISQDVAPVPFILGSQGGTGLFFVGMIDEPMYYNNTLTAAEVAKIYDSRTFTITGTGFDATPANNTVTVGGQAATVLNATATQLVIKAPAGATSTSQVTVTIGGNISGAKALGVVLPPRIDSLSRNITTSGRSITINGGGFSSSSAVAFNGTPATITSSTSSALTVTVPTATAGTVTVSNGVNTANGPHFEPMPNNLLHWYQAETNANDVIGALTGTQQGDATFAAGNNGQAFTFDGAGDYINVPDDASMDVGAGEDLTVAAWVNVDAYSTFKVLNKGRAVAFTPANAGYSLRFNGGNLQFDVHDGTNQAVASTAQTAVPLNQWHHIVGVFERGANIVRLYVDGVEVDNTGAALVTNSLATNSPFAIGALSRDGFGAASEFMDGEVDETVVFKRALTVPEIQALYQSQR